MHRQIFIVTLLIIAGCTSKTKTVEPKAIVKQPVKDTTAIEKEAFKLTDQNAIPFLFEYGQEHPEHIVRITTPQGSFEIMLFDSTPYHRANFIYLTRQGYFDVTYFHRVVKDFIIQGGNSDDYKTSKKRRSIGKYLLPPDTKNELRHHYGTVSMPSSEIENPHKLASPYEFFIVQQRPGAYHLDGSYTVFGKVISGMEIVDQIAQLPTDNREWPIDNVYIKAEVVK